MSPRRPRSAPTRRDPPPEALLDLFGRCFGTPEGRRVLDYLRRTFLGRRVPPTAPDAVLRHVEGQRSVVAHIDGLVRQAERRSRHRGADA